MRSSPSRRGFFRLLLALPVAPKCVQAYRMEPVVETLKPGDIITMDVVYREGGHTFHRMER